MVFQCGRCWFGVAVEMWREPLIAKTTAWSQWAAEGLSFSRFPVTCLAMLVLPRVVRSGNVRRGVSTTLCHTSSQELVL